ncbi:MAG: MerR family DNA-binding protein [Gammaproteobacteria bacterium]|jgi:DNA-binding transcriptional MerR regulator
MLTVHQLAVGTGVTTDTIRHYTRIGLLKPERDKSNGYKLFKSGDRQRVRFIRQAKNLGFTLREIQDILDVANHGNSPCPQVREIIQERIHENRRKLEELMVLQHRMEEALARWEQMPDGIPDGHSVCHLIEAIDEQDA